MTAALAVPPMKPQPLARVVRKGCAQLFVIFAARDDLDGGFSERGALLRHASLGARNLVLVRDPYADNFAQGLGGPIGSAAALAAWLADARAEMTHVREVYCVGHSSGGYGALLFGHLLGADRVFAFSPRPAVKPGAELAKRALVEHLSTHNGKTAYTICYSPGNARDQAFVDRLAGCAGITLMPRPEFGNEHNVFRRLLQSGELASVLPSFVAAEAS